MRSICVLTFVSMDGVMQGTPEEEAGFATADGLSVTSTISWARR